MSSDVAAASHRPLTGVEVRTLALASLGGALEFYDFVIFVFYTAVIGTLFFPPSQPDWLRQVETFGLFAAGYLARPLGGGVMAHFGDTRGRKRMFTMSVMLMAISTLLIGLLPTYGSIGIAAPLLMLLARIAQGAAIGGEAPGGWVFVAEHVPRQRTGLALGLLTAGLSGGILFGSLMATLLNLAVSPAQNFLGFWRLPFLIGGLLGFIAMWLRKWLQETPVFQELRRHAAISHELPLRVVLRDHGAGVVASILSTWLLTAAIVVVILMTPAFLQKLFNLPPHLTLLANLAGTAALCISVLVVSASTDRFGLRRTAIASTLLLVLSTAALYSGAARMPSELIALYVAAGLGAGVAGLTPVLMVRAFPPSVRFSGLSFSYNLSYALFGGLTPLLLSWLVHFDRMAPVCYVGGVAAIALAALLLYSPRIPDFGTCADRRRAGSASFQEYSNS
jgi:MFS family permease